MEYFSSHVKTYMTCVFPSVLKTAKVVLVFKKNSDLEYSNYRPISLLSNIENNIEIIYVYYQYLYLYLY